MEFLNRNRPALIGVLAILLIGAIMLNGMSAATAVSILLSGITLAALYFLVASGISIIFGLMGVLNFAHGSLFMIGAYAGWTFYTNPRLLFNTAPFFLILVAGLALNPILARRLSLPALGRWLVAILAGALIVFAVRDFPLDKLVAMGMSMTGRIIPTAEAQEPLNTMLMRMAFFFLAGLVANFAIGAHDSADRPVSIPRVAAMAAVVAIIALALLLVRDFGEQAILQTESNLRFFLALAFGTVTGGLLGGLMEWGLIRPLYSRHLYQILLTLGLVFVSDQSVQLVFGPGAKFMETPGLFGASGKECPSSDLIGWFTQHCNSIMVLDRAFPSYRLFIILVGVIMLVTIALILQRSRLGMIIRAGVQDSQMVEALGINVRRIFTIVFALGAALAGLGGVVASPFLGVYPGMAMEFLLQAFIVVVIGGLGSIPGAAIGALLLGLARAYGDHIVLSGVQLPWMASAISGSPAIARASTVLIMAIVLFLKPTGLFGKEES